MKRTVLAGTADSRAWQSLWLFAVLIAAAVTGSSAPLKQPNILVILADDLGKMDLSFENPRTFYETPNLDRLAKQGVRFTDGYSACPVCSPSRYSLQTGKYPVRSGLTDWLPGWSVDQRFRQAPLTQQMPLEETTLAQALKPLGYETAFVGKWHLGPQPVYWPEARGYDTNIAGCFLPAPPTYFSPYRNPRLADGPAGEYLPERLAGEAIRLLEGFKASGRPFFLCYCDYLVHRPIQAPAAMVAKYRAKAQKLGLDPGGTYGREIQYQVTNEPRRVRLDQSNPIYAAMVEALDTAVGRLLGELERLGLADNTLVIFTSDNGGMSTQSNEMPTSNMPYRAGKGWIYEGGIREPFVIRWPGKLPIGATRSAPVCGIDIYPTVLEAVGAAVPEGVSLDGQSILPAARGEKVAPRNLFWHYPHYSPQGGFPGAAVRSGDLKLVEDLENGETWLFDLKTDLSEKHDLTVDRPADASRLRMLLADWQRETGAKFLRAKPGGPEPWHPMWWSPKITEWRAAGAHDVVFEPWQTSLHDD